MDIPRETYDALNITINNLKEQRNRLQTKVEQLTAEKDKYKTALGRIISDPEVICYAHCIEVAEEAVRP